MQEFVLKNSIKTVGVKDEDGNLVCTLKIDSADSSILDRFFGCIERLEKLKQEVNATIDELKEREGADENETLIEACKVNIGFLNKVISEIDGLFGPDTVRNVYRANYELNPYFVPDEIMLIDFLEGIMPVMESIYGERMKEKQRRFNVNRKGGKR